NFQLSSAANSANNTDYKPQEARTSEIGTKWDLLNQRLALTAALYRTEVLNEVEQDPVVTTEYHQNGKKRVKGIELSAVGRITDNWNVSAGYAL
ncbi:TonB-dependent receptor, partial [Escherichia coli]